MIRKILIANRGEIACRIIRTCRSMGIAAVAVYSDADANALHVEMADEAVYIGASPASESYLRGDKIIDAAKRTGADAIHPGYGFLSENGDFAQAIIDADITWIGPPVSAIRAMGKKRESKLMLKDVPLIPGYNGEDQSDTVFVQAADEIGYPVMVKASAGGGGKGMRRVDSPDDLPEALAAARREAKQAFGDETLILEKCLIRPRHIEIQIFGDMHGSVIAMGERECSIQRRHQKIIEETPSTALDDDLRQQMCDVAVNIGKQLRYYSAGTVEFLVDADKNFYFMEMNTRLQVEHPVTEMVTGVDLVRWQILNAQGDFAAPPNTLMRGHAVEARVYTENPQNDFLPITGRILKWFEPTDGHYVNETEAWSNARIDSGIRSGDEITPNYDPMIAKVIAFGETRGEAIRKLDYALYRIQLLGIKNNIAFLRRVINHPDFIVGNLSTSFIDDHPGLLQEESTIPPAALIAAAVAKIHESSATPNGYWRNSPNRPIRHIFGLGEDRYEINLSPKTDSEYDVRIAQLASSEQKSGEHIFHITVSLDFEDNLALIIDGHRQIAAVVQDGDVWWVHIGGNGYHLDWVTPLPLPNRDTMIEGSLRAPMTGQVISVRVEVGQAVNKGDILLILEAMKMEHRIQAPYDGSVGAIRYQVGDNVQADAVLLELIKPENA